jgi:hypothetical protein
MSKQDSGGSHTNEHAEIYAADCDTARQDNIPNLLADESALVRRVVPATALNAFDPSDNAEQWSAPLWLAVDAEGGSDRLLAWRWLRDTPPYRSPEVPPTRT